MKKTLFPDYESLSKAAAERLLEQTKENPALRICLATGSSPTRCYELYVDFIGREGCNTEQMTVVKLDEWGGMNETHEGSCEYYIRKYFNGPLGIPPERYLSFRADLDDPGQECARISKALKQAGGLDVSVLGLGLNGHLGFNEPAESMQPFAHVANLSAESQQHSMMAGACAKPTYGLTLGMAELLQSKLIILIVNGTKKKAQLERLMSMRVDPQFPATFLWLHPNVELYCDIE